MEKYLMSEKTLIIWIDQTDTNTYKGCPIEIDNSISYGGVEHIEADT